MHGRRFAASPSLPYVISKAERRKDASLSSHPDSHQNFNTSHHKFILFQISDLSISSTLGPVPLRVIHILPAVPSFETHNRQSQRNKNQALVRDARFSRLRDCSVSQRFQFSFFFANSAVVARFRHSQCLDR